MATPPHAIPSIPTDHICRADLPADDSITDTFLMDGSMGGSVINPQLVSRLTIRLQREEYLSVQQTRDGIRVHYSVPNGICLLCVIERASFIIDHATEAGKECMCLLD